MKWNWHFLSVQVLVSILLLTSPLHVEALPSRPLASSCCRFPVPPFTPLLSVQLISTLATYVSSRPQSDPLRFPRVHVSLTVALLYLVKFPRSSSLHYVHDLADFSYSGELPNSSHLLLLFSTSVLSVPLPGPLCTDTLLMFDELFAFGVVVEPETQTKSDRRNRLATESRAVRPVGYKWLTKGTNVKHEVKC